MRSCRPTLAILQVACVYLGAASGFKYGGNHPKVTKDNKNVAAAFPDIHNVDLHSPAFTDPKTVSADWPAGKSGPTPYEVLDRFVQSIAARNDWLSWLPADFQSEEGRPISYAYLSSSPLNAANSTKLKVYIQGSIHGDEPGADQSILALLGKMDANQTWTASLLEIMDIKILPRWNVDGVNYFQRRLASNFDPNRDCLKLDSRESRNVRQVYTDFDPHIAVDMHEYSGPRVYGGQYQNAADVMLAGGNNLNIHRSIGELTFSKLIPTIGKRLEHRGLRWKPYVTGKQSKEPGTPISLEESVTDASYGRNAMGLGQAIGLLVELRGLRLADQHFQRRVASGLLGLEFILEYALDHHEEVRDTLEAARNSFIDSKHDIVLTDKATTGKQNFELIDMKSGSIVKIPIELNSTWPTKAVITRTRPQAYLIPRTWISLVDRLRVLGLEVETLDHEYHGTVQAYNITATQLDTEYYEGHVLNTVSTEPYARDIQLPVGSFLIDTKQKNAGLAFAALEPENTDSYVTFGLVNANMVGDEIPYYRIVADKDEAKWKADWQTNTPASNAAGGGDIEEE